LLQKALSDAVAIISNSSQWFPGELAHLLGGNKQFLTVLSQSVAGGSMGTVLLLPCLGLKDHILI